MKRSFIIISLIALSLLFLSCKKKNNYVNSDGAFQLSISDSDISLSELAVKPVNHAFSNKKVLVLLGYSFNTDEIKEKVLSRLEDKFGFSDCGAMLFPLCFPDDFKRGGHSYATELYNHISDPLLDLGGIVLIGAPEYTHLALARNQDDWNQTVPTRLLLFSLRMILLELNLPATLSWIKPRQPKTKFLPRPTNILI